MAKVKICGLTREEDIDAVNEVLPDYIGFVFAESKRKIDENRAAELKKRLDPRIKAVGVFVNDVPERIIRLCRNRIIDVVQLHGDEDETYIKQLKKHVSNEIIRAIRVRNKDDIENAMNYSADFLLFDTYREGLYGGSGKTFDWLLVTAVNRPFFLAGGINPENAIHAIKTVNPYCIDVSSGVETNGVKDPGKIADIVTIARQYAVE